MMHCIGQTDSDAVMIIAVFCHCRRLNWTQRQSRHILSARRALPNRS